MKKHGDENALTCALKKPDDNEPECDSGQEMPDYPNGAAAHLNEWDEMPKRPDDTENERRTKNAVAVSKTWIGISLQAQFFTNSPYEKGGKIKQRLDWCNLRNGH